MEDKVLPVEGSNYEKKVIFWVKVSNSWGEIR